MTSTDVATAVPAVIPGPADVSGERPHGAVTLFEIPFATAMNGADVALLTRTLDLSRRMHPEMLTPGVARLDHYSGLFLERGAVEGQWTLQARTWGDPAAQSVHEWHVMAAGAAHQLDATVPLPERLSAPLLEIPDRPLGRVGKKRLARIRRRMVGLS